MMENALYYTLSTVAQALAAALAILIAVALSQSTRVSDAIQSGPSHPNYVNAQQLRPRLKDAVGLSLLDIALCFVALPFTPTIARDYGVYVAAAIVVLGVACLALYWRLLTVLMKFL
jgi:hypothetical protein